MIQSYTKLNQGSCATGVLEGKGQGHCPLYGCQALRYVQNPTQVKLDFKFPATICEAVLSEELLNKYNKRKGGEGDDDGELLEPADTFNEEGGEEEEGTHEDEEVD